MYYSWNFEYWLLLGGKRTGWNPLKGLKVWWEGWLRGKWCHWLGLEGGGTEGGLVC